MNFSGRNRNVTFSIAFHIYRPLHSPHTFVGMKSHEGLLLIVVHGVGDQTSLGRNVESMRRAATEVFQHSKNEFRKIGKIDIVHIEYHSLVHNLEEADSRASLIMMKNCHVFRNLIKDYLCDPLYYFTQHFGRKTREIISKRLNAVYDDWMKTHPNWRGKIAICAHSLGGIIAYDILVSQQRWRERQEKADGLRNEHSEPAFDDFERRPYKENESPPEWVKLNFIPSFLFMMGSPFANCILLRNHEITDYKLPKETRAFNIFHPFDPLAYRMEPLYNTAFKNIAPVTLPVYLQKPFHVRLRDNIRTQLPKFPDLSPFSPILQQIPRPPFPIFSQFSVMQLQIPALPQIPASLQIQIPSISDGMKRIEEGVTIFMDMLKTGVVEEGVDEESDKNAWIETRKHLAVSSSDTGVVPNSKRQRESREDVECTRSSKRRKGVRPLSVHHTHHTERKDSAIVLSSSADQLEINYTSTTTSTHSIQISADNAYTAPLPTPPAEVENQTSNNIDDYIKHLPRGERIDYQLPSKFTDNISNEYMLGLRAHFGYWANKNLMYFILNQTNQS
ncbi:DDHD domain-containing protein [Paraphysoderma sedebokerense]|nr:DDHD domain-containing protein [Paraphysoderma sedebokerense]